MFQSIQLFDAAGALARHAGARSATIANNIAHADTPGYRAQAVRPFEAGAEAAFAPRRSRAGHLGSEARPAALQLADRAGEAAPNGNTVSLEQEMMQAARASSDHTRALAVYRHAIGVIRASLGPR